MLFLNNFIDFFIPKEVENTTDVRYRYRLLVGSIYICLLILIIFDIWFTLSISSFAAIVTNFIVTSPLVIFYVLLLFKLRNENTFESVAWYTVFLAYIGTTAGVGLAGGPFVTSANQLLIIPPVLGLLLLGRKSGIILTLVVLLTNYSFVALAYFGFKFPEFQSADDLHFISILHWTLCTLLIIGSAFIYEYLNQLLTKERDEEKSKYQFMAYHDPLTKLPNRKLFNDTLESTISRANRHGYEIGLLLINLNGFKQLNDTFGHEAGDAILCHVAEGLKMSIRKSDHTARLSGDEFSVIVENVNINDIEIVSNKLLDAISRKLDFKHQEISITGSIGVALYPSQAQNEENLRKNADIALYYAKKNKQGWCFFSPQQSKLVLNKET